MSDYQVAIRKGVAYISRWDSDKRERVEKKKTEQVLSDVLQFPLHELSETTFGEFFSFIIRERELYEKIFKASMYGHPIEPYIEEIAKPPVESELERVEVYWHAEVFEGDVSLSPGFHGWGKYKNTQNDPDMPEKGAYAIEFTPLYEYKMLPFIIDTDFVMYDIKKSPPEIEGTKGELEFTVYDVIKAILYEITWSGDISKGRGCPVCKEKEDNGVEEKCPLHTEKKE